MESGGILCIDDNSQELRFDLVVVHQNLENFDEETFPEGFELRAKRQKLPKEKRRDDDAAAAARGDDLEIIEEGLDVMKTVESPRLSKTKAKSPSPTPSKKRKIA